MGSYKPLEFKHYLIFEVAKEKFAFDILDIDSIHTSNRKCRKDNMEDLRTAVRLYKKLLPIINLEMIMGLQSESDLYQPSIVFLKNRNQYPDDVIGVQVDRTIDIIETAVPKLENNKPHRLVKMLIGQKEEVIHVLRVKDIVSNNEHVPVKAEIMN
jgi:chemotaxis signal transduction protein